MRLKSFNIGLLILPILIFSLGYISLLSTSPDKARTQLIFFIVGYAIYIAASFVDLTFLKYYWKLPFFLVLALLVLTFVGGVVKFGASSWLRIGVFTFEPSEFAKIALIVGLSALIVSDSETLFRLRGIYKLLLLILPVTVLVLIQPDLGTALVLLAAFVGVLFYAGLNKIYFFMMAMAFGIFSSPIWSFLHDYQKRRILVLLNPNLDVLGSGYNVTQAMIALGSGRLLGKGFGMGTQSHLGFLPVYWTDFIFSSFSEEWGFVGAALLLILYAALLICLIHIAYRVKDAFGSLVCIGTFVIFFFQFLINVGMNLGMTPVTGVTLPLVSYGGSSIISSFILLGLVQSFWRSRS